MATDDMPVEEVVADVQVCLGRLVETYRGAQITDLMLAEFATSVGVELARWSNAVGVDGVRVTATAAGEFSVTIDLTARPETIGRLFADMPNLPVLLTVGRADPISLVDRLRRMDAVKNGEARLIVTDPGAVE